MSSIAAIAGARNYRFAGFGDNASVLSNANAAYAELDSYGSGSSPAAPSTTPSPANSSSAAPSTSAPTSYVSSPAPDSSSSDSSSSDDSSGSDFLGQLASGLSSAGEGILMGAVSSLAPGTGNQPPAPAPVPVAPPQLYFGLPAPVWIIGLGFLFLSTK